MRNLVRVALFAAKALLDAGLYRLRGWATWRHVLGRM